jgi:glutaredoxin
MPYQEHIKKVSGKKTKDILVFSLSTCVWCDKSRELLDELGLEYGHLIVDLMDDDAEQQEVFNILGKYGDNIGFPMILINDGEKVIMGFNEAEIRALA